MERGVQSSGAAASARTIDLQRQAMRDLLTSFPSNKKQPPTRDAGRPDISDQPRRRG
jgi:hypothetical protein